MQFSDAHGAVRMDATDEAMTVRFLTVSGDEIDAFTLQAGGGMPTNTDPSLGELGVDECEGSGLGCATSGSATPAWAGIFALIAGLRRRRARCSD